MSAENRWAQQREWANERLMGFDREIKSECSLREDEEEVCMVIDCACRATKMKLVGFPESQSGVKVFLCGTHDTDHFAWSVYKRESESD